MRSNLNKIAKAVKNSKLGKLIGKALHLLIQRLSWELLLTARYLSLGMQMRQWAAMWLICLMLLPIFALPAGAATVFSNAEPAESIDLPFEPVNEAQPAWKQLASNVNLAVERLFSAPDTSTIYRTIESSDKNSNKPGSKNSEKEGVLENKESEKPTPKENLRDTTASVEITEKTATAKNTSTKNSPAPENLAVSSSAAKNTTLTSAPLLNELPDIEQESLFYPENNLGTPAGKTEQSAPVPAAAARVRERNGIGNFSFEIPFASLSGRGLNAGIGASYNSRVWNKSYDAQTSQDRYAYNVDKNWMAPGFTVTFGYLDSRSAGNQNLPDYLVTPSGTRHSLKYTGKIGGTSQYNAAKVFYETTDGSFIKVTVDNDPTGPSKKVFAQFPDGSIIDYPYFPNSENRRFAASLTDNNGNRVSITYIQNDLLGRISEITDTLGRKIKLYYDSNQKLASVTTPVFGNSTGSVAGEQTVVRFFYEDITLNPKFAGTVDAPQTVTILKNVYYPGSKTGYQYDYSPLFGMIYKITRMVGMTAVDPNNTSAANNVSGTVAATTEYNYPLYPLNIPNPGTLNDVPEYTTRTDDWVGRAGGSAPVTSFSSVDDTVNQITTSTITSPDGTVTKTVLNKKTNASDWDNGLIKETSVTSSTNQLMQKIVYGWDTNSTSNPRVLKLENINEVGLSTTTKFQQYDQYNNVTKMSVHDFAAPGNEGAELKRVETTYETRAGWVNRRLIHLPTSVITYVGTTKVSRTDYEYDKNGQSGNPALLEREEINGHNRNYNPYLPPLQHCTYDEISDRTICITTAQYDPATDYRGNVTKVTKWADANNPSDPLAETNVMKYDVAGNIVEATMSCCQLKKWVYSNINNYAYPVEIKKGMNEELSSFASYDFNSGLVISTTDENNQPTTYEYEADTLRQKKIIYPNGGYTLTEYSDQIVSNPAQLVPGFVRTTTTLEANKTVQGYSYFDGRGATIRTATQTPSAWSVSAIEYDSIGRPWKTYNPFYAASQIDSVPNTVKWTQVENYDGFGRPTKVKLQDGSFVESFINEASVSFIDLDGQTRTGMVSRAKDQADKERRQIVDALGRIVRVDEPTDEGLGSPTAPKQPTFYYYDGNDNLSRIVQEEIGGVTQERKFKYDSLSRLTHEKQVEANPTLDANGDYGAPNASKWTKVLKYDNFGRLVEATDARGVKTNFIKFDGLNRIEKVTFSDGTPQIDYFYDETRPGFFNNGALTRIQTATGGTTRPDTPATATEFDYDSMGRIKQHRQTIGSQTYNLEYGYNLAGQLTSEKYPSGKIVAMSYDAGGRLSGVTDQGRTYLGNLQYGQHGGAVSAMTLGNGIEQSFNYNDRLQIDKMTWAKNGSVVQRYDYTFGELNSQSQLKNNGKLAQIDSYNGGNIATPTKQFTQKFDYDPVGNLKTEIELRGDNNQQSYKQTFDYDRFGNRYLKAASNPSNQNPLLPTPIEANNIDKSKNQLASNTGTIYDAAGNVTIDGKFRSLKYSYDANGRMYKTSSMDDVNQSNAIYDASGQRVAQQIDGVWKFFVYDAFGKMVAEYGGTPATDEGGVKYIQQDIQGSTRAITSVSGAVKARMDYAAFGEEVSASIGQRTAQGYSSSNGLRQKYALTERDDASGLDHTWFRKHENRAGRWTSPDPYNGSMNINNPQSFNRYSYVENQPTNFVDPSGLQLTYRDYYAGLSCVFDPRDGKNHCVENIYRLWYDNGIGNGGGEEPPGGGVVGSGSGTTASTQTERRFCVLNNTRITFYDSPKGNTAIAGKAPKEGRTVAADPTFFGYPYPRGGSTPAERQQNTQTRARTQAELRSADIIFVIPGLKGLFRNFEDVGGAVDGNRIDVYVDKNAMAAAREYNKENGDYVNGVLVILPKNQSCPQGSSEITAEEAGF